MASDPISTPNPSASDPTGTSASAGAAQAAPTGSSPADLPDPFASDPFQASTGDGTASAPSTDSSSFDLPDPFASDPLQPSPGGASTSQSGFWINDPDPQFLIQWSLEEGQDPQLGAQNASQAAPPTTYKARVRIFQEIFETTLAATRPVVPFSLRDATTGSVYLQGSLALLQQPSGPPPVLLVKNLKFSGFQQAQVVLFPSTPDVSGGESGG